MDEFPFELRLPPGPYRFQWSRGEPGQCEVRRTAHYLEQRFTHADGVVVVIRRYALDGSYRVMASSEIKLIDRIGDLKAHDPMSVVLLP